MYTHYILYILKYILKQRQQSRMYCLFEVSSYKTEFSLNLHLCANIKICKPTQTVIMLL